KALVTIVNGVMCHQSGCDEILGVENVGITVYEVFDGHRIHVMNDDSIVDLVVFCAEVTSEVASDDFLSHLSPLHRPIERLVEIALVSEGLCSDRASKGQISEPFLERVEPIKLRVRSNHRRLPHPERSTERNHGKLRLLLRKALAKRRLRRVLPYGP